MTESDALNAQRRAQIAVAALRCFSQKGFHSTTMVDIAKAVGMSAGNLYNYYKCKADIVSEISKAEIERMSSRVSELHDVCDEEAIRKHLHDLVLTKLDIQASRLVLEVISESARNEELFAVVQEFDAKWRSVLLAEYMKCNRFTLEQAQSKLEANLCMMDGLSIRILAHPQLDREALAAEVVDSIMYRMRQTDR